MGRFQRFCYHADEKKNQMITEEADKPYDRINEVSKQWIETIGNLPEGSDQRLFSDFAKYKNRAA